MTLSEDRYAVGLAFGLPRDPQRGVRRLRTRVRALAGLTEDDKLRERLLEMARSWMAAAMGEADRSPTPE